MSRSDADALLRRALELAADRAGVALTIARATMTRWASATFAGARHELVLEVMASPHADEWLAGVHEAELPLRGYLVADLKVIAVIRMPDTTTVTLEVLTVEER